MHWWSTPVSYVLLLPIAPRFRNSPPLFLHAAYRRIIAHARTFTTFLTLSILIGLTAAFRFLNYSLVGVTRPSLITTPCPIQGHCCFWPKISGLVRTSECTVSIRNFGNKVLLVETRFASVQLSALEFVWKFGIRSLTSALVHKNDSLYMYFTLATSGLS